MNTYQYIVDKYKIEVGRQYIVEIPDMGRKDLAKLFAELKFKVGAEIGVWRGEYSAILCGVNPELHLYSVDSWQLSSHEAEEIEAFQTNQEYFDGKYKEAVKKLAEFNCTIVKKDSMDAIKDFKDNSLDFVYIDANHDFVNFTNDLHYWLKKIRLGGIVSGHDYAYHSYKKFIHVKRALIPYARSYRMIPLFVAGAMEYKEGTTRDAHRSWFWVKK